MKNKNKFMDLKVPVFYNKRTGQASVVLPKKKMRDKKPRFVKVRI